MLTSMPMTVQAANRAIAASSTHSAISTISPVSSAIVVNGAGDTSLRAGYCQRSNASTPRSCR